MHIRTLIEAFEKIIQSVSTNTFQKEDVFTGFNILNILTNLSNLSSDKILQTVLLATPSLEEKLIQLLKQLFCLKLDPMEWQTVQMAAIRLVCNLSTILLKEFINNGIIEHLVGFLSCSQGNVIMESAKCLSTLIQIDKFGKVESHLEEAADEMMKRIFCEYKTPELWLEDSVNAMTTLFYSRYTDISFIFLHFQSNIFKNRIKHLLKELFSKEVKINLSSILDERYKIETDENSEHLKKALLQVICEESALRIKKQVADLKEKEKKKNASSLQKEEPNNEPIFKLPTPKMNDNANNSKTESPKKTNKSLFQLDIPQTEPTHVEKSVSKTKSLNDIPPPPPPPLKLPKQADKQKVPSSSSSTLIPPPPPMPKSIISNKTMKPSEKSAIEFDPRITIPTIDDILEKHEKLKKEELERRKRLQQIPKHSNFKLDKPTAPPPPPPQMQTNIQNATQSFKGIASIYQVYLYLAKPKSLQEEIQSFNKKSLKTLNQ